MLEGIERFIGTFSWYKKTQREWMVALNINKRVKSTRWKVYLATTPGEHVRVVTVLSVLKILKKVAAARLGDSMLSNPRSSYK